MALPSDTGLRFDGLCSFRAKDLSIAMALNRHKLCIKVSGPTVASTATDADSADEAVLALARLIGRQIAREQFEQMKARTGKQKGSRPARKSA